MSTAQSILADAEKGFDMYICIPVLLKCCSLQVVTLAHLLALSASREYFTILWAWL